MNTVWLFASFFLRDPRVVATFAVATLLLTLAFTRQGVRRGRRRLLAAVAAGASLGLIVAFTWPITSGDFTELSPIRWDVRRVWEEMNPADDGFGAWSYGTDGPLNVLLYIPAGAAVTALIPALSRAWAAPAALALTSLLTEIWQALDGGRSGQLSDVISNTIGALIGTTVTVLVRLALARHAAQRVAR